MEPELNRPSPDDVKALLEIIPDDKTRRAIKEMMEMIVVAKQAKTDKRLGN